MILYYISDETLRRRIQRGLNKEEAVNALARTIFFCKRGELRERELQDRLQIVFHNTCFNSYTFTFTSKATHASFEIQIIEIDRMLSRELKNLEMNKLIMRTVYPDIPVSVEYTATEYFISLECLITKMIKWGKIHREKIRKV